MPIKIRFGNLIKEITPSIDSNDMIVHQVNAMGVMGSGFAKELRETYPEVFTTYSAYINGIETNKMGLVLPHLVEQDGKTLLIQNVVGQFNFGRDGKRYTSYDALDTAFKSLASVLKEDIAEFRTTFNVHFPAMGCGLGGGSWPVVEAIINTHLTDPNISCTLWLPKS